MGHSFATPSDRRSFVEMCLERSCRVPLRVAMDTRDPGKIHPSCTCNRDGMSRFVPNEVNPCEWHFVFESLVETRHLERIRTLDIMFGDVDFSDGPGGHRAIRLFFVPSLLPNLCSLSFTGSWNSQLMKFSNLISFTLESYHIQSMPRAFERSCGITSRSKH